MSLSFNFSKASIYSFREAVLLGSVSLVENSVELHRYLGAVFEELLVNIKNTEKGPDF